MCSPKHTHDYTCAWNNHNCGDGSSYAIAWPFASTSLAHALAWAPSPLGAGSEPSGASSYIANCYNAAPHQCRHSIHVTYTLLSLPLCKPCSTLPLVTLHPWCHNYWASMCDTSLQGTHSEALDAVLAILLLDKRHMCFNNSKRNWKRSSNLKCDYCHSY